MSSPPSSTRQDKHINSNRLTKTRALPLPALRLPHANLNGGLPPDKKMAVNGCLSTSQHPSTLTFAPLANFEHLIHLRYMFLKEGVTVPAENPWKHENILNWVSNPGTFDCNNIRDTAWQQAQVCKLQKATATQSDLKVALLCNYNVL